MVYKCTFPVQANRFLRLQVFASSPSLHFSVHLSFLFISCFCTRILQYLKLRYTGKEYQFAFDPTTFKVEENSRTFQGLTQTFKDFSRTPPEIQGLFMTVQTLSPTPNIRYERQRNHHEQLFAFPTRMRSVRRRRNRVNTYPCPPLP